MTRVLDRVPRARGVYDEAFFEKIDEKINRTESVRIGFLIFIFYLYTCNVIEKYSYNARNVYFFFILLI